MRQAAQDGLSAGTIVIERHLLSARLQAAAGWQLRNAPEWVPARSALLYWSVLPARLEAAAGWKLRDAEKWLSIWSDLLDWPMLPDRLCAAARRHVPAAAQAGMRRRATHAQRHVLSGRNEAAARQQLQAPGRLSAGHSCRSADRSMLSVRDGGRRHQGGLQLPEPVTTTLQRIGVAALPVGLMAVGAALQFGRLKASPALAATLLALRHAAMPAVAIGLASAFVLPPGQRTIVILFGALPTASSSYVLAARMGGDAGFVAGLVTLSTLLGMVTIPFWLALLGSLPG